MSAPPDERDPDFREKVRAECNAENKPEPPALGCLFPWCLCNRYPAKVEAAP